MDKMQEPGTAVMNASISLGWLLSEPIAVQRRVTKAIADDLGLPLEFKHVEAILSFATEENRNGKQLALPLGWTVFRERDALVFTTPDLRIRERTPDYQYTLRVPGSTTIPETYSRIETLRIPAAKQAAWNPDDLFDPALLNRELVVRNWRAGDRFWPAHTKAPKKLKELLQDKHLPRWIKKSWPVVQSGDEIIWVRGFPGRAQFRPAEGQDAVAIRELPLDSGET
jgi:tRNA(Ile)-lysidine synthase